MNELIRTINVILSIINKKYHKDDKIEILIKKYLKKLNENDILKNINSDNISMYEKYVYCIPYHKIFKPLENKFKLHCPLLKRNGTSLIKTKRCFEIKDCSYNFFEYIDYIDPDFIDKYKINKKDYDFSSLIFIDIDYKQNNMNQ